MARSLEWIAGQKLKPAVVIAGSDEFLRDVSLNLLLDRLEIDRSACREFDADVHNARSVISDISMVSPLNPTSLVVYRNCHRSDNLEILFPFVDSPTPGITLCLVAPTIRDKEGVRWIPSTSRVLYIDCDMPRDNSILTYCRAEGLSDVDALWLLEKTRADVVLVLSIIDLMYVFPKPWPVDLLKDVCPPAPTYPKPFEHFHLPDVQDNVAFCRALKHTLRQLTILSINLPRRLQYRELAQRIEAPEFVLKRLVALAQGTSPDYWLDKLVRTISTERYAEEDCPGIQEFIQTWIA